LSALRPATICETAHPLERTKALAIVFSRVAGQAFGETVGAAIGTVDL
jgi:hypothetical protein